MRNGCQVVLWLALATFVPLSSDHMDDDSQADRLESWKAIANYLGKSVRTARRWESEEGLPVRRQMHKSQASVFAFRADIDEWRGQRERENASRPAVASRSNAAGVLSDLDRSVLVLPFSYLGPQQDNAYIADGFTAEIISGLSRLPALRVISWTSSMTLKDSGKSIRDIGRLLGVSRIVEGTVRHEGERVRVSAQLVLASSDDRVWSHRYDDALERLFYIQERIANDVAEALETSSDIGDAERLTHEPSDLVAWQCLVQARQASLRWRKDSIDQAVRLLREGIAVAGKDARLYAALGRTYLHYREAGIDLSPNPIQAAETFAGQARAISPELPAVHQLQGWLHYARADISLAIECLSEALESEPRDPDTLSLLANCYLISGRPEKANPLIERVTAIDPLTPLTRCMPGWAAALAGRFDAAIGPYREMFELDPENPMARLFLVYMLAAAGRREDVLQLAGDMPESIRGTPPGQLLELMRLAMAGEAGDARVALNKEALTRGADVFPRFAAQAYALAGNVPEAVRWVAVAADRGFINFPYWSQYDPFLRQMRGDERYEQVLAEVERRWRDFPA